MGENNSRLSGWCLTNYHDGCKHEFNHGSEYINQYFTCECECHNGKFRKQSQAGHTQSDNPPTVGEQDNRNRSIKRKNSGVRKEPKKSSKH